MQNEEEKKSNQKLWTLLILVAGDIKKKAQKITSMGFRNKMLKGRSWAELSHAEKENVIKRMKKKYKPSRIAQEVFPEISQGERERIAKLKGVKSEQVESIVSQLKEEAVKNAKPTLENCIACEGRVSTNANACPHCGEPNPVRQEEPKTQLKSDKQEFPLIEKFHIVPPLSKEEKKNRDKNAIALLIFVIFICCVIISNIHIISGSGFSYPKIVKKESFGFKETFINVDEITSMPYISARSRYPISVRVLQKYGYIEDDEHFKNRVEKEMIEDMNQRFRNWWD